jgi:hypothetical protein
VEELAPSVEVDSVGNVSEVLPWHGGILPNHGDMNARLVGAAYDTSTISRRCVDDSPTAKTYNVIRQGAASGLRIGSLPARLAGGPVDLNAAQGLGIGRQARRPAHHDSRECVQALGHQRPRGGEELGDKQWVVHGFIPS